MWLQWCQSFLVAAFFQKRSIRFLSVSTPFKVFGLFLGFGVHRQAISCVNHFRLLDLSLQTATADFIAGGSTTCASGSLRNSSSCKWRQSFRNQKQPLMYMDVHCADNDKLWQKATTPSPSHRLHSLQPLPCPEGWNLYKYLEADSIALAALCHLVSRSITGLACQLEFVCLIEQHLPQKRNGRCYSGNIADFLT